MTFIWDVPPSCPLIQPFCQTPNLSDTGMIKIIVNPTHVPGQYCLPVHKSHIIRVPSIPQRSPPKGAPSTPPESSSPPLNYVPPSPPSPLMTGPGSTINFVRFNQVRRSCCIIKHLHGSSNCYELRSCVARFNELLFIFQDVTSLALGSSSGYKLFSLTSVDKLEPIYSWSNQGSPDAKDGVASASSVIIVERLFSSSLLGLVNQAEPRKLRVSKDKLQGFPAARGRGWVDLSLRVPLSAQFCLS